MKKSIGAKTLVHPAPVFVVGSYDAEGNPNMMNVAWGGICNSAPPSVAISVREATFSHGNILRNEAFTVCIPSVSHVKEADYVGIYSGRDENKFEATGLTPVKSQLVNAPYVREFPLVLECKLLHVHNLGLHTQFVGEILDVKADEEILNADGLPDMEKMRPIAVAPGTMGYYALGEFIGQAFSIGRKA